MRQEWTLIPRLLICATNNGRPHNDGYSARRNSVDTTEVDETTRDIFAGGEFPDFPGARSLVRGTLFGDGAGNRLPVRSRYMLPFTPEIEIDQDLLDGGRDKICRFAGYEWGLSPASRMLELTDADRVILKHVIRSTNEMLDRLVLDAMTGAEPACTNASTASSDPVLKPLRSELYPWDSETVWASRMRMHPWVAPSAGAYFSVSAISGSESLPDWRYIEHPDVPNSNEDGTPCFSYIVKDELLPDGIARAYILHPDTAARMRWAAAMDELLLIPSEFLRPLPGGIDALKMPPDTID